MFVPQISKWDAWQRGRVGVIQQEQCNLALTKHGEQSIVVDLSWLYRAQRSITNALSIDFRFGSTAEQVSWEKSQSSCCRQLLRFPTQPLTLCWRPPFLDNVVLVLRDSTTLNRERERASVRMSESKRSRCSWSIVSSSELQTFSVCVD